MSRVASDRLFSVLYRTITNPTKHINPQTSGELLRGLSHDVYCPQIEKWGNIRRHNSAEIRENLFHFFDNGTVEVIPRTEKSKDLMFLNFQTRDSFVPPKTCDTGAIPFSEEARRASNLFSERIVGENVRIPDGFRYQGRQAVFNESGENISRFRSGDQEMIIIDREQDRTLQNTISAFICRIQGQYFKYAHQEDIMIELMKFVDEIFSFGKKGGTILEYVKKFENPKKAYLLGDIINSGAGVCRHRALTTKLLGDTMNMKTRIITGYYDGGGHAWNEFVLGEKTYIFDAMQGNIFDVTNRGRNIPNSVKLYRVSDPKDTDKMIPKYC